MPSAADVPGRSAPWCCRRPRRASSAERCSPSRAAGETAPVLFTIGIVSEPNWNVFDGPNTTLSQQIFLNANQPFAPAQQRAWAAALTLILIVFVFLILARIVTAFFSRRQGA